MWVSLVSAQEGWWLVWPRCRAGCELRWLCLLNTQAAAHPGLHLGDDVGALLIWEVELLMCFQQMGLDSLEIFSGVSLDFVRNLLGGLFNVWFLNQRRFYKEG